MPFNVVNRREQWPICERSVRQLNHTLSITTCILQVVLQFRTSTPQCNRVILQDYRSATHGKLNLTIRLLQQEMLKSIRSKATVRTEPTKPPQPVAQLISIMTFFSRREFSFNSQREVRSKSF